MIDSHCHLDFAVFADGLDQELQACQRLGVSHVFIPGTVPDGWQRQLTLTKTHEAIGIGLGCHPYFLTPQSPSALPQLASLLDQHPEILAVGEIGLDRHIDVDWALQVAMFEQQCELANQYQRPVIVHHRRSHNDLIRQLKQRPVHCGGIIHGFSGSLQDAETYLDLGFLLGVGGTITYPRAHKTRQTICALPLSALVLETDAPDMPLNGKQGQINRPRYLPEVATCLAALRTESLADIADATTKNLSRLLRWPLPDASHDNATCKTSA
ncbi:TatD family hydrolase [Aestuariibacter halophilus]|uniref:TatD family hydrolase n=1 Tax=Fluctibacter halophilus TaxID=226011 RepID=A0ABS8G3L7_9ALTE|nr:TatD family hydrolase [Aestuariibacter halophilus]MCC2614706.1 TatD family hydrolase [Aestuariibacter halophilus]